LFDLKGGAVISLKYFYLIMLSLLLTSPAQAGMFGPSNYDECITESMKGVTSNIAARAIINSCRKRFPKTKRKLPPSKRLSILQRMNIQGRVGLSYGSYYAGNLYNGNSDFTITEISVSVTTKIDGKEVTRIYLCKVHVTPLTSASFGFDILKGDKDADYSWGII